MVWLIAFALGGLISLTYLWLAQRSVKKLTDWASEQRHGTSSATESKPAATLPQAIDEPTRRARLLETLRREYILDHDNLSSALLAGTEQPPAAWVNQRLKQLGETWKLAEPKAVPSPEPQPALSGPKVECSDDSIATCTPAEFASRLNALVTNIEQLEGDQEKRYTEANRTDQEKRGAVQRGELTQREYDDWYRSQQRALMFFEQIMLGKYRDNYKQTAIKYRDAAVSRIGPTAIVDLHIAREYENPQLWSDLRDVARDLRRLAHGVQSGRD
jgi:hypothetical protein